jgi:succinyl-diaminopimelate desuccinylase
MPPSATSPSPSDPPANEREREVAHDTPHARALDETLLWLCSIPSPIGEEADLCDALEARLARLALSGPIRRYANSIVVPLRRDPSARRPHIALVGHLDTVRTENGPARIEGDRCFGAGSSDMKSGLVLMLSIAETPDPAPLGCDLSLVFYAKEEGNYADNELGPLLEADVDLRSVDLAVCLEPSDNRVQLGCAGSIHASVTFEGKTAHSARPWQGENAVTKAAGFLAEMHAIEPIEHVIDGFAYKNVFTVTQAKDGGRGRNIVPDRFVVNVNHRFSPDVSSADAMDAVRALVKGRASVEFTDVSPPAPPNAQHPLVRALIAAGVAGVTPKQAWTDVGRFAALGVPAVNWGPGENAQAHQKNESTSLRLIHEGDAILRRFLRSVGSDRA